MLFRTNAPISFERAGKVGLVLIAQTDGGFLDVGAVAQQFNGLVLSQLRQPVAGGLAGVLVQVSLQGVLGDFAELGQCRDGPFGLPRQFRPVVDVLQFVSHAHSLLFSAEIILLKLNPKAGHVITVSKATPGGG